jgi:hypothetical protein
MKNRYRLYRRKMGGVFYVHDSETGKQESLGTRDRVDATTLLNARNESVHQLQLNRPNRPVPADDGRNDRTCGAGLARELVQSPQRYPRGIDRPQAGRI